MGMGRSLGVYVTQENIRTTRLAGGYRSTPNGLVLPINPLAPAAVASAVKAVANGGSTRKTLGGGYVDSKVTVPPYRGLSGVSDMTTWLTSPNALFPSVNNAIVYGGIAVLAYMMVGRKRR